MKIQLAQSTILNTDLRIIKIDDVQCVVRWNTQRVIGTVKNGKFSQDPLVVRTFQNRLDMSKDCPWIL